MNKSFRTYLIILTAVIAVLVLLELNKTEIINWRKSFELDSKAPFGLIIFNQQADELFHHKLERIKISPYEYLSADSTEASQNLLFINKGITSEGWNKIMNRVKQGDDAFFMGYYFERFVTDTLGFSLQGTYYENTNILELIDLKFQADSVYIDRIPGNIAIHRYDSLTTRILGATWFEKTDEIANFIEVKHGKGKLFFHTEPMAISNYYLLKKEDYKYVENVFSYLPDRKTIWFQDSLETVNTSPLRFILNQKSLRYAWYLSLFGFLLFIIFHVKRRQRIVPVIEPLKNSSAEFVKTIGNLYLQEGNYKDMANKKATYFLNKVRSELLIDTNKLDETFKHRLQLKTGAKKDKIDKVMLLIEIAIHPQAPVQQDELLELNKLIDEIYQ